MADEPSREPAATDGPGDPVRIRVDVWSDLVCPWCHIGLHRLRRVAAEARMAVDVVHHAFQLDPERIGSGPTRDALARKYGAANVDALLANATSAGAAEGLHLRLGDSIACNTHDGHRLVAFAATQGLQDAVVGRLMKAHFEESADLGDPGTLVRLAAEAGLPLAEAKAVLADGGFGDEVDEDLDRARQMGVRGVPFFVFAGRYAFSGAQPDEAFREALRLASVPATA
ncbi:MAG TPA: DsbA family oxidoreductase [Candidatus Thermoplasmatota archaeon]|nr:DsbA family oxidoreductase [Candidatus Thermoplasmatota archaeon]